MTTQQDRVGAPATAAGPGRARRRHAARREGFLAAHRRRVRARRARRAARRTPFGRHPFRTAAALAIVGLTPVWWSLGSALENPSFGISIPARLAEWVRDHGGAGIVVWGENLWYSHHAPKVGGTPPKGAIPVVHRPLPPPHPGTVGLPPPAPLRPFASPPLPGEGRWRPAGRLVDGIPAVYETELRPDALHTSYVVGVAWMDTKLLRASLYSGSYIPGGGPWPLTAPIEPAAARTLVAAFNAGFRLQDSQGGYYTDHRMVAPLRPGAASFVIYRDGAATVGEWGRDVRMTPSVVAVRQNLSLLVDHGRPVPGLQANDTSRWGFTLGNQVYVWRSGVGVTADGALVYVGGPGLNITDLAALLARAGCLRAMELDINTDWVNFATFDPGPHQLASPANGTDLLPDMAASPARYFASWWTRDFFTMSAR